MPDYRSDMLVRLLQTLDRRTNEQEAFLDENTIEDLFFPLSEKLTLTDEVTVSYYTAADMCWGNGTTINAGWNWNGGGRWWTP